jgi:hypothetical protein
MSSNHQAQGSTELVLRTCPPNTAENQKQKTKEEKGKSKMNKLMLHCGGTIRTREEVFAVPTPSETSTYVPLPYESFITRIEKQLMVEGMKVKSEQLALSTNGQRLFGLIEVEMPGVQGLDYGSVIGIRNSYDKSISTGLCIGASVFVCDNLSFSGEITFARKHTAGLMKDLAWLLTETVSQLPAKFARQTEAFNAYRQRQLSEERVHHLIVKFLDEKAINVTDIPIVLKEWRTPTHPEFYQDGQSAWRLFNAATEALKGGLWMLPDRTRKIHAILDRECGLNAGNTEEEHVESGRSRVIVI